MRFEIRENNDNNIGVWFYFWNSKEKEKRENNNEGRNSGVSFQLHGFGVRMRSWWRVVVVVREVWKNRVRWWRSGVTIRVCRWIIRWISWRRWWVVIYTTATNTIGWWRWRRTIEHTWWWWRRRKNGLTWIVTGRTHFAGNLIFLDCSYSWHFLRKITQGTENKCQQEEMKIIHWWMGLKREILRNVKDLKCSLV